MDTTSPPRPLPLSQRLAQIASEAGPERLSFTELAKQLHARAWGGLLLVFAAINVIPLPPGTSIFFAIPLLLVSAQMVFGRASPWFPKRLDARGVTRAQLQLLIAKIEWIELRVERIFKPRLAALTGPTATRLIGVVCFVLGLGTALPFVHMAPAAVIVLFALSLIYRDGALVIVAAVAAVATFVLGVLLISSGFVALSWASSLLAR